MNRCDECHSLSIIYEAILIAYSTYTNAIATMIKKNPRKMRRQVSCFLSNGCDLPPHAPAQRQQHTHNLIKNNKINRNEFSKN